ncbi:MAG TPA: type II toxin-antitoxin system prevent-host-death family antitoxin [Actinophytocola sp.]|jgi:prevent-host-death family protein|uniref:type II toxin-antitoxin system Phd/YefM family antitoxin n=1 Tax=Actinophytocola sp. TaxID=1872138 RepID=UPI002DFB9194|nr:type II toxin-antitoxin system prevent-host-death family antitoxin [Actinophytocola sp.]
MEQIPVRVLNQDTAGVLARVEEGNTVEITSRGKPVARIVPVYDGPLADLVAQGRVTPATNRGPWTMPTIKAPPGSDAGALIRQLRDEERS